MTQLSTGDHKSRSRQHDKSSRSRVQSQKEVTPRSHAGTNTSGQQYSLKRSNDFSDIEIPRSVEKETSMTPTLSIQDDGQELLNEYENILRDDLSTGSLSPREYLNQRNADNLSISPLNLQGSNSVSPVLTNETELTPRSATLDFERLRYTRKSGGHEQSKIQKNVEHNLMTGSKITPNTSPTDNNAVYGTPKRSRMLSSSKRLSQSSEKLDNKVKDYDLRHHAKYELYDKDPNDVSVGSLYASEPNLAHLLYKERSETKKDHTYNFNNGARPKERKMFQTENNSGLPSNSYLRSNRSKTEAVIREERISQRNTRDLLGHERQLLGHDLSGDHHKYGSRYTESDIPLDVHRPVALVTRQTQVPSPITHSRSRKKYY